MKGWKVALLCLAISALAIVLILLFIRGTEENTPQVDIPSYTADQVMAAAKAYAGEQCGGYSFWGVYIDPYDANWTTVYQGDGRWTVTKECESAKTWIFYETTGELKPS